MTDFDVARIVPSTRDLLGAVRNNKKGLALIPRVEDEQVARQVMRLDELAVRALVTAEAGRASLEAARATNSIPLLVLAPVTNGEACQRARFFGADAVCLSADHYAALAKSVQSMRMMPVARVTTADELTAAVDAGARVVVIAGGARDVIAMADAQPRLTSIADTQSDEATLRSLSGHVDAAIVAPEVHVEETFEELLDALD